MVEFILNWFICAVIGTIIGIILRKKFNISKRVNDIGSLMFMLFFLVVEVALSEFTKIRLYDIKVYVPSTFFGLGFGWLMSSSFTKKKK